MMLRSSRRRSGVYAPQLCAAAAALFLLLLSLSVLHSRLSSSTSSSFLLSLPLPSSVLPRRPPRAPPLFSFDDVSADAENDAFDGAANDDRIDELDVIEEDDDASRRSTEEDEDADDLDPSRAQSSSSLFWDHAAGVARRSFGKPERPSLPDPWGARALVLPDRSKIVFGSDDQPVGEDVRLKLESIRRIEDVLLLKIDSGESPLRKGWSQWLEGKGDYLRRDRMLRSNLELLNPKNHPLLQDPDGPGLMSLTRGDRLLKSVLLKELTTTPFGGDVGSSGSNVKREKGSNALRIEKMKKEEKVQEEQRKNIPLKEKPVYADGRRWGYFPGLHPQLKFSDFMERFLERCSMKVFMVWNTPAWMFGVRHQRGLESLLHHHRDACVVVFSETLELDFFKDFVKDGFKIAVAMPNLDELLKDTPTNIFASVWFEWRKTKHYPIHYSELIRLAALFKYGGIYLDSDIIVLKPLHQLKSSIPVEDQIDGHSVFNGAVMAFEKNSTFLFECLKEFYSTYNDALLRWNGADLMTRVINRLAEKTDKSSVQLGIKIEPQFAFYPVRAMDITRYFAEPSDEIEMAEQQNLYARITNESITFHLWNSLTSALVPEPKSLIERVLDQYCLHCLDIL